jgi:hypothetical protein
LWCWHFSLITSFLFSINPFPYLNFLLKLITQCPNFPNRKLICFLSLPKIFVASYLSQSVHYTVGYLVF